MKKYVREILDDLRNPPTLENQTLSKDPAECVRQLDQQAQKSEERQRSS